MIFNIILIFLTLFSSVFAAEVRPGFTVVDKIIAEVYTPEGKSIITKSDLRPGIDGAPRQIKDVVLQKLILLDGKKLKLVKESDDPEYEAEVDKHIMNLKKQHNLTQEDILGIFKESGYTYEEGRNELRNMKIIDSVLDHRIRGKIYVEKKEMEDYYSEHPKSAPPTYKLAHQFIPYDSRTLKEEQLKKIEKTIQSGVLVNPTQWEEPFELSESDIAEDKSFLKDLPVGAVSIIEKSDNGVKLLRIVEKSPARVLPLEDSLDEIRNILYANKYQEAMKKYYDELWKNANVRYIDPTELPVDNLPVSAALPAAAAA